jgi:hypothetical protein
VPTKQSIGDSLVSNEAISRKNTEAAQPPAWNTRIGKVEHLA